MLPALVTVRRHGRAWRRSCRWTGRPRRRSAASTSAAGPGGCPPSFRFVVLVMPSRCARVHNLLSVAIAWSVTPLQAQAIFDGTGFASGRPLDQWPQTRPRLDHTLP